MAQFDQNIPLQDSVLPLQALHGPVELVIPTTGRDLVFRTSGKKNRGCIVMLLYTASGEKSSIEIPFVHIEGFAVLTNGNKPAISMHLSEFAAKNLALRLGTRDKIEHIMRSFGEGCDLALRKLVFVLQPYKDDMFVQVGTDNPQFYGIEQLYKRIDVWVRFIRNRDQLAKEQRQAVRNCYTPTLTNSTNFLVSHTPEEWLELLRSIHLFLNPDNDCDTSPYRYRPPDPRPIHPHKLKIPKLVSKSEMELFTEEVDSNGQLNRRIRQQAYENGQSPGVVIDASNNAHGEYYDQRYTNEYQPVQVGITKQNVSHIVPMKGRNFNPSNARAYAEIPSAATVQHAVTTMQPSQWQIVQQGTVMQIQAPNAQSQYVVATGAHGTPLRGQPVVVQAAAQRTPVVYQVSPSGHQAALIRQATPDKTKVTASGAQLLIVNHGSPGRITGVVSTPQPTLTALKRPVRSARLRKEVETIALDDDDEACEAKASSSSGGNEGDENGNGHQGNGEPSEKKARLDENIRDEVLLVFPPGESGAVSLHFEDLRVLAHGEMLNDNIIEFYLKYIRAKLVEEEQRDKVFVFNTFFYQKLTEKQPSISILNKNHRSSVGRYLVIIVKPALAVVTKRTEDVDQARKRGSFRENPDTFIVVLDSLPDPNDVKRKCVLDILRDYLECELADKRGTQEELYLDRTRIGALYPAGVPHQENYVDCGLYLLQFAEAFLMKPPTGK
ncbi:Ulp1 protease family, catalytic domain protein, partial [Ancylostoma duodenale]